VVGEVNGIATLSVNGVELSSHVSNIQFTSVPEYPAGEWPSILGGFSLHMRGMLGPYTCKLLLGITHPRIRRMHSMYRRRRKWRCR